MKIFKNLRFSMFLGYFAFSSFLFGQTYVDSISVEQLTDGSGLIKICYKAHNVYDSTLAMNVQAAWYDTSSTWDISVITILDTMSVYSRPNQGWRVAASPEGIRHCFLWDIGNDIGKAERCGFKMRFSVFDSILSEYSLEDSFRVMDTLRPFIQTFGLGYRHGQLWILFHNDSTHDCWVRPYSMPDVIPGDSFYIGSVTVGPSDMTFAGDRLFWTEDTRMLLKEYDFETGESNVVCGDWWDLPGTSNHLAGAAFDGEHLWVCFCEGTFIALDTTDFSLVDTIFFPEFGESVPATCADGLAWGLGLLWCYSNDNIVYAIDVHEKRIVYEIPTGAVALATGAEGAAWDGTNLWVLDYGRGFLYKISLFGQIRFYNAPDFCFDNIPPRVEWISPACPDFADTFLAGDTVQLRWSAQDSNLSGGQSIILLEDDTIADIPAEDTTFDWNVLPWFGWDGAFEISVRDSFMNKTTATSCLFMIAPYDYIGEEIIAPDMFSVSAYPNPFNSYVAITVSGGRGLASRGLASQTPTNIKVYDIMGNVVYKLPPLSSNSFLPEEKGESFPLLGERETQRVRGRFTWTPDESVPSGIYLIRATIPQQTKSVVCTKRIVYLK
ncbi:hypothetical protein J7M00_00685 [bacterium]|nr:hypothetical protein [bacterium]